MSDQSRALPTGVICYVRPGATLPERMGWETCGASDAGALAVREDGRALPAHVKPVAWIEHDAGGVSYSVDHAEARRLPERVRHDLFTAAQVQAAIANGFLSTITDRQVGACIEETELTSRYAKHQLGWWMDFVRSVIASAAAPGASGGPRSPGQTYSVGEGPADAS